jgi:hypothetical protein
MVRAMKTNRNRSFLFAALSVPFLALSGAAASSIVMEKPAHAESSDGLGVWEGSGVTTEAGNKSVGDFTITLTRTARPNGVTRSDGVIKTRDGKEIIFWQEKTDHGGGTFALTSNLGAGGGCCFSNGMCQSFEQRAADGHAFASTISVDAPNKVRVLITELKDGKAVRFYAQTLAKK